MFTWSRVGARERWGVALLTASMVVLAGCASAPPAGGVDAVVDGEADGGAAVAVAVVE